MKSRTFKSELDMEVRQKMTRAEVARKVVVYWIPCGLVALVVGAIMVEADQQAAIVSAIGGKWVALMLWMIPGVYYGILMQTNDPFWPVRKRLWKEHTFFLLVNEDHDKAEPFIWNKGSLPAACDVADQL